MDHISVSQINTLLRCGRQYELRYLQKVPTTIGGALVKGSAYHAALEAYFHQAIHGFQATLDVAREAFQSAWRTRLNQGDVVWDNDPEEQMAHGLTMVEAYVNQIGPTIRPAAVEERFEVQVPGIDVPLVGIIDLTEGSGAVVDHKTASSAWSDAKLAQELQPFAYLYARQQLTGQLPPVFRFDVAVDKLHLKRDPRVEFQRLEIDPLSLDFGFFETLVRRAYQQIAIGTFTPNPTGWWCSPTSCSVWDHCRGRSQ